MGNTDLEHDQQLARRSQLGDENAYAELVRRHRRTVYVTARRILGSVEEAEDVTQEALLRALRGIGTYSCRRSFASWIGRISANCAINRLREQQREHRRLQALASTRSDLRHVASPKHCLVVGELAGSIRDRVGALPLKQRAAFTLFHLQEMSLAQTAQATGCSVNATKVQLHRARRRLARRLADHLQQG